MNYDHWKQTDPNDDSERELALEVRREAAFREYLEDGFLPDGRDAGDVDTLMIEAMPDVLDQMVGANCPDEMLAIAESLAARREKIIRSMIEEEIK